MYALVKNEIVVKYPFSLSDFRKENTDTSFPDIISQDVLLGFGVVEVGGTQQPTSDDSKTVIEGAPVFDGALWLQKWNVIEATSEEIAERTERKSRDVRYQRGIKLDESDWTQVLDAPVDQAAWATYRQALRDISAQAGFPATVVWPTQP